MRFTLIQRRSPEQRGKVYAKPVESISAQILRSIDGKTMEKQRKFFDI